MTYGGYDPTKSFQQNLTGTLGTIGSWVTPQAYAAGTDPIQAIQNNPQGIPSYIPPDQAYLFSGAAKGNVATPQTPPPQPTGTQNTSPWTSTPAPVQQQSGGGPGYGPSFPGQTVSVGGVTYRSNADGSWSVVSGGGGGGASEFDLNAVYSPGMQTLADQEALLRARQPQAEAALNTSYQEGESALNKNLADQSAVLGKQEANVTNQQGSALAQARQLYNELAQNYSARFGSRTSAGPFAMEILGRETQKQFGNINQGATQAVQDIQGERVRLQNWVNDQTSVLQSKKRDAVASIQQNFAEGLATINAQRNQLESAKAAARIDLLQAAKAQTAQANAAIQQFQQQLQLFQMETDRQLAMKASAGTGYDTNYLNATGKIGDILSSYGPQAAQQAAAKAGVPYNFAPQNGYEYVQDAKGQWVQKKIDTNPDTWYNPLSWGAQG